MGVGGELEATRVIKSLYCLDQTDNAFGNQIRYLHASVDILARHRHDQALIAHDHLLLCIFAYRQLAYERVHIRHATRRCPLFILWHPAQLLSQLLKNLFTSQKLLDVYGELHFLSCCEQVGACLQRRRRCEAQPRLMALMYVIQQAIQQGYQ